MRYLILITSNPHSRALWETMTDDEQIAFGQAHFDLTDALAASGEPVISEGLVDVSEAKRVSVREGKKIVSDGPFAETKEYLAGFYLVECENLDHAIKIAARVPDAQVEVRPVFDMSIFEL